MKFFALVLAAALALSSCATTTPAPTRAPEAPPRAAAEAPERRDAPARRDAPEPIPGAAPDHWWLLDAEADGVRGTSVERAYAELLAGREPARTVVVAIIDSGVDVEHEDLRESVWANEGELPGTGRDDDGNGYPDDVHGWNFIGGPDGRNVDKDTYEVARLKAACRANGARGPPPPPVPPCDEVRAAFEAKVEETGELVERVRGIDMAVRHFYSMLEQHLGVDSLTTERVSAIRSSDRGLAQAREVYLQLAAEGITLPMIADELQRLERRMEYGLNPDFDPRDIVGDDYDDLAERNYGNPDVRGPDASHGTHVAGIIAAGRGNGVGIDGIAPPAVRIMSVRAVPDGDERDKDVANAIRYAVDNGAHIINMSFGKAFSPHKEAVDAAVRYADERGVLMVHAAGNDSQDVDTEPNFPSKYYLDGDSALHWIEVGASGWRGPDRLAAPFTNYGRNRVDVFAPGVAIRSTIPDDEYQVNSGTSMAAPVVSGIAALLMAYFPELDAADVRRILLESAARHPDQRVVRPGTEDEMIPFGELSRTGGIVNAYRAVRMAEERTAGRP